jgi:hypothetical protein
VVNFVHLEGEGRFEQAPDFLSPHVRTFPLFFWAVFSLK